VRPACDLVDRNFYTDAPDKLWVPDLTCVPTWTGFLYLSVVPDAFSQRSPQPPIRTTFPSRHRSLHP
jgi:putative transposase